MASTLRTLSAAMTLAFVVNACGGDDGGGTAPEVPASLTLTGGNGQTGEVGAALAQSLSVRLTSNLGNPSVGVVVTWSVVAGGGSVTQQGPTGSDGVATASWTLGMSVGPQEVQASAAGLTPVSFTATATVGAAATITLAQTELLLVGLGQSGELGPIVVEDAFGNALDPSVVSFSSANEDVATVDDDGTVTSVGVGQTMVTATAGLASAAASVEVQLPNFAPQNDTEISGDVAFAEVLIPAGVTVTVTGATTFNVTGSATVEGTLIADCHALTLNVGADLVVTGTVDNGCAGDGGRAAANCVVHCAFSPILALSCTPKEMPLGCARLSFFNRLLVE